MAIAGDTHNIPSFLVTLKDGQIQAFGWATNKPRELVERSLDRAVDRLRAGERFQLHCSGPQVAIISEVLKMDEVLLSKWRQELAELGRRELRQQVRQLLERLKAGQFVETCAGDGEGARLEDTPVWKELRKLAGMEAGK